MTQLLPPVLRPLRDPALALLWGGLATSAGYLNAPQAATILAVALLAGRWADRRDHRRMMIAADLFRAATLQALAVLRQSRLASGDQAAAMRAILVAANLGTLAALLAAPSALQAIGVAPAFVVAGLACIASGLFGAALHRDAID